MKPRSGKLAREKLALSTNPLRLAIGTRLTREPATAAELAETLDIPVERVRYQVKRLLQVGLIEIQGETRRRGVAERVYYADGSSLLLRRSELADLPEHRLRVARARLLRTMFREAIGAARSGSFSARDGHVLVRIPFQLDGPGWEEAGQIHDEALERVLEVKEASRKRLEESGEDGITAAVMVAVFRSGGPGAVNSS